MIGRAPLFYYLAHIPLIHLSALLVNRIRTGAAHPEWYLTAPGVRVPETFRWPLPLLYLIFAVDVALLYALCKWFEQMTRSNPHAWMRYL